MFANFMRKVWAGDLAEVGAAAGDALTQASVMASAVAAQVITFVEQENGELNRDSFTGRYRPETSALEEAPQLIITKTEEPDAVRSWKLWLESNKVQSTGVLRQGSKVVAWPGNASIDLIAGKAIEGNESNALAAGEKYGDVEEEVKREEWLLTMYRNNWKEVEGLKLPMMRDSVEIQVFSNARPLPEGPGSKEIENAVGILVGKEGSKEAEKEVGVGIKMEEEILLSDEVTVGVSRMKVRQEAIVIMQVLRLNIKKKNRVRVVPAKVKGQKDKEGISLEEVTERFDFGKSQINRECVGARPVKGRKAFDPGKSTYSRLAPKRARGARLHRPAAPASERSRSVDLSNNETGRRCQRIKRNSWAAQREKRRTRNAELNTCEGQSAPLSQVARNAARDKSKREIVRTITYVQYQRHILKMSAPGNITFDKGSSVNVMFDPTQLDEENRARIKALKEDAIAEKEEHWGKKRAAAWGNLHTLVPVSAEERRDSLVPFTSCKCENDLGVQVSHIDHSRIGAHLATITKDRRKHGGMGADLGIGRAGEGAVHLPECQQMTRWERLAEKGKAIEKAKKEQARAEEEESKKKENKRRLLVEVNSRSSIPKEEGRASLMRKGQKAAEKLTLAGVSVPVGPREGGGSCERARQCISTLEALQAKPSLKQMSKSELVNAGAEISVHEAGSKIERARRCIFALQKLKQSLPSAKDGKGPQGAQLGGSEPFNALWGGEGEEEGHEGIRAHREMLAFRHRESINAMQRKLAQNIIKKKAAKDPERRVHL